MIKITIEIREVEGSVTAKSYANVGVTQTVKEHQMTSWFMQQFDKLMTEKGAEVVGKRGDN